MADSTHSTEWRAVVGFPDYEVSDTGLVRVFPRTRVKRKLKGRLLKQTIVRSRNAKIAAVIVTLFAGSRGYIIRNVGRLVLEAFVGPCPPNMECCHGDGDPINNALGNLRWDTHRANVLDAQRHGTLYIPQSGRGETHSCAILSAAQVAEIRCRYAAGDCSRRSLAREFGVSKWSIENIVTGKSWKTGLWPKGA